MYKVCIKFIIVWAFVSTNLQVQDNQVEQEIRFIPNDLEKKMNLEYFGTCAVIKDIMLGIQTRLYDQENKP